MSAAASPRDRPSAGGGGDGKLCEGAQEVSCQNYMAALPSKISHFYRTLQQNQEGDGKKKTAMKKFKTSAHLCLLHQMCFLLFRMLQRFNMFMTK